MPNPTIISDISTLFSVCCALYDIQHGAVCVSYTLTDEDKAAGFDAKITELENAVKEYNSARIREFCGSVSDATMFIKSDMSTTAIICRVGEQSYKRAKVQNLSLFDYFRATMTEETFGDFCADVKALREKVYSRALCYVFDDKQNTGCVSATKKLIAEFCEKYGINLGTREFSSWMARRLLQCTVTHTGKHCENVRPVNDRTFVALISIFLHCLLNGVKPRNNADKEDEISALIKRILTLD